MSINLKYNKKRSYNVELQTGYKNVRGFTEKIS